jgi:hypothetical protein
MKKPTQKTLDRLEAFFVAHEKNFDALNQKMTQNLTNHSFALRSEIEDFRKANERVMAISAARSILTGYERHGSVKRLEKHIENTIVDLTHEDSSAVAGHLLFEVYLTLRHQD